MATILAVGIATLDIINSVDGFPHEDDEVRACQQRICRGGNATNTLVVLSQLGHQCHWAGTLANDSDCRHIEDDLQRFDIHYDGVTKVDKGKVPTSYITHNRINGSRTIVHYRDLPEYGFDAFQTIDISQFDWLHFEGRNIEQTRQMMEWVKTHYENIPISLEAEKPRQEITSLFPLADLIMFSRPFAKANHHSNAEAFLQSIYETIKAKLTCTWGEAGAWAIDTDGKLHHSPAFVPETIVDTLAAGDSFNAALIHHLVRGEDLATSLTGACKIAGQKCGHQGLDFIHATRGNT